MNIRDLALSNFNFIAPKYMIKYIEKTQYHKPVGSTRMSRFSEDTFNRKDRDNKELWSFAFTWERFIGIENELEFFKL